MTVADIPATDGAPDQGTEGIRFMGYTLYDPLVMWDLSSATEPAKLVPGLATKWNQDPADPTKWIFELRQGVKFHDGSDFDADAVIFSLDRALNDKSSAFDRLGRGSMIASLWPLVAYRKLDPYKVELQTKGVDTVMPSLLNRFPIASPANFEKVGKDWQAYRKSPSGTGPWKMKAWTPRERAELERNTDYWNKDRIPKTERMVVLPIPDVSTRTAALLSGRVDWIEFAGARLARQAAGSRLQDRNQRHPAHVALCAEHAARRADRRHPRPQGAQPRDRPQRHGEAAERARRAGRGLRAVRIIRGSAIRPSRSSTIRPRPRS